MPITSIGDALFTKTQKKVIGLLFGKADKRFYTNEIMRLVAMGRGTVGRELERLVAADLISMTKEGNQNYYQANAKNPIFNELISIVKKSFGIADEIKDKLKPLDNNLELAFIYGSISKGSETKSSDIDLMLVGKELSYGSVMDLLMPLEELLLRTVNPTIYEVSDFKTKLKEGNSFITRVMDQPKIMIKGSEDDIRAIR